MIRITKSSDTTHRFMFQITNHTKCLPVDSLDLGRLTHDSLVESQVSKHIGYNFIIINKKM